MITALMLLVATSYTADVHGTIEAIDVRANQLSVHHHMHAGMEMEMTMIVQLADRREFRRLHRGDRVTLRCDASRNPWVCIVKR